MMHSNKETTLDENKIPSALNPIDLLAFIKKNTFCTFITYNPQGLFISHINLIRVDDAFFGHLSKANPQAKQLAADNSVIAVFNHSVHVYGKIRVVEDEEELISLMQRLVSHHESERSSPWCIPWEDAKYRSQLKGIVGFKVIPNHIARATLQHDVCNEARSEPDVIDARAMQTMTVTPIYTPSHFAENRPETLDAFIHHQPICTIITYHETGYLQVYHTKLIILSRQLDKLQLTGRLIVADTASQLKPGDTLHAVAIFQGPHTYISPTLYKTPYSVPTWNYVTVHAEGKLSAVEHQLVGDHIIVDIAFDVSHLYGKYKLNQNRTLEDRQGVIAGLNESDSHADQEVGQLMQKFSL